MHYTFPNLDTDTFLHRSQLLSSTPTKYCLCKDAQYFCMNSSVVLTCYMKYTITFIVIQHDLQYNVHDSDYSGVYTNRTHIFKG